jgi:hypothetical protein
MERQEWRARGVGAEDVVRQEWRIRRGDGGRYGEVRVEDKGGGSAVCGQVRGGGGGEGGTINQPLNESNSV